jgi:cobalt-zinc-cadmium efflux system outer membrane protein
MGEPGVECRRASCHPALMAGLLVCLTLTTGCAVERCAPGRPQVDAELMSRVQHGVGPSSCVEPAIPADVDFADGVSPDEAVAVALWNNSAFNATLARLGISRGDLIQAGLLRNPQFLLLLPGGTKQLEWALFLPVEALLLRETRLDMSEREVCRVAEELVQNGLDLVRDVRVAHTDLAFAIERASLAEEAVQLRQRIADLTQKQLGAGDISELEAASAVIAAKQAEADAAGLRLAVAQAEARLKQLMGLGRLSDNLTPILNHPPAALPPDLELLISEATASRPDLRAASFAVAAAQDRAELARKQWLRFDLVADKNAGGAGPTNFGPGFRFDIPIFDRNQGGVHSADWTVYQATQNYNAVRDQIISDVQTAYWQYRQADENLTLLRANVLTSLDETVTLAGKAFSDGGTSYFLVLQTTSQYLDARVRELQLTADLRRAAANLDRSVGRNLTWEHQPPPEIETGASDNLTTPAGLSQPASDNSEPNILILSGDGSALFTGPGDRERVGETLRRIADELDASDRNGGRRSPTEHRFGENPGGQAQLRSTFVPSGRVTDSNNAPDPALF